MSRSHSHLGGYAHSPENIVQGIDAEDMETIIVRVVEQAADSSREEEADREETRHPYVE